MVIGAVHGRTHQIAGTGVHAGIFPVGMLEMPYFCDKTSVWTEHISAKFRIQRYIIHSGSSQDFIIDLTHLFTDQCDVIFSVFRLVGNSDSAGEIDKSHMASCFLFKISRQLKENARKLWIIGI